MAGEFKMTVAGIEALRDELYKLAPELRRGPARRALVKGMAPVLARAIALTPKLAKDIYRDGKMIRRAGTLKRALTIRSSKDVNKTGDVGVFVNIKPLAKGAVADFKAATGRKSSSNPQDPFFWRFVHFATKRNNKPRPFLTQSGEVLQTSSLGIVTTELTAYFARLNKKAGRA